VSENGVPSRRSTRSNIGVQPTRFGNPVSSNQGKSTGKIHQTELMPLNSRSIMPNLDGTFNVMNLQQLDDDSGSMRSRRSIASTVSVFPSIRKLIERKETRQKLMKLKKRRLSLELEGCHLEGDLMILETKMSSHLQKSFLEDDVQKREHQKVFNDLKSQIDLKSIMHNSHQNTSKCQLEMIEEEMASILHCQKDDERMEDVLEKEQNLGTTQGVICK
jgi:hypothetical protein